MTVRQWLTVHRRKRCIRRGHPMADWSPVVFRTRADDTLGPNGEIIEGDEFTQYAWRCAIHDKES